VRDSGGFQNNIESQKGAWPFVPHSVNKEKQGPPSGSIPGGLSVGWVGSLPFEPATTSTCGCCGPRGPATGRVLCRSPTRGGGFVVRRL